MVQGVEPLNQERDAVLSHLKLIMSNPLRFGQTIAIKVADFENVFVMSDGHIKTKAQLLEVS